MPSGNVNITVLQHGRTPLEGVTPTITIRNGDSTKTFTATATKKPGVYRASVTFPTAGQVDVRGQRRVHRQPGALVPAGRDRPDASAAAAAPPKTTGARTDDGGSLTWLAFPGIALLAAAAAILLLRDRRRRGPGHQPQAA